MSLDMSEKCQHVPVRIHCLFEQNVLKAVGRTQIRGKLQGVCRKDYCIYLENKSKAVPLQARSEEQLKHSCR